MQDETRNIQPAASRATGNRHLSHLKNLFPKPAPGQREAHQRGRRAYYAGYWRNVNRVAALRAGRVAK